MKEDTTIGQLCRPNHVAGNNVILSVCLIPYNNTGREREGEGGEGGGEREVVYMLVMVANCELWLFLSEAQTREGVTVGGA